MDALVPQNCYGAAILSDVYRFSSGASFCQSPGFYSSTMVVLWLLTGAEISNMGEQCECTLTSWPPPIATSIYEIDDQDIISNSMQCSLPQNSDMVLLPSTHSTFPSPTSSAGRHIGAVVSWKWGPSQYYDVACSFLISECHPVLLLGQKPDKNVGWFIYLFSEKLNSYLSQVFQVSQVLANLRKWRFGNIIYPYRIPSSVIMFTSLPVILR